MAKEESKECPDCGIIMRLSDGVYTCLDPECGYVEYEDDEEELPEVNDVCPCCGQPKAKE